MQEKLWCILCMSFPPRPQPKKLALIIFFAGDQRLLFLNNKRFGGCGKPCFKIKRERSWAMVLKRLKSFHGFFDRGNFTRRNIPHRRKRFSEIREPVAAAS